MCLNGRNSVDLRQQCTKLQQMERQGFANNYGVVGLNGQTTVDLQLQYTKLQSVE